jgi:methionyl aminopeptidase
VCVSVNEEVIHGIGCDRCLSVGDLVKIDVGVKKGGWIGDTAMTVCAGPASDLSGRLVLATEAALFEGIKFAKAGCYVGDISAAVEAEVTKHGFSVVRDFVGQAWGGNFMKTLRFPTSGRGGVVLS